MLVICKLFVLFLCLLGYVLFLEEKTGLKIEFIPVILFSSIIFLMFIAGLLNCMLHAVLAITLGGLVLLVFMVISILRKGELRSVLRRLATPGTLFFALVCCYFIFLMRDISFTQYDEFSHWGLVARDIFVNNRLPNFTSNLILFQAYPPGSALWIYFVTRVTGFSESMAYIAQSILIVGCVLSLFAFVNPKKNAGGILLTAVASAAFAMLGCSITHLLVDNLLGVLPLANLAVIIYYRRDILRAALPTLPLASATILVKNSGMFFALINMGGLLIFFLPRLLGKTREKNGAGRRVVAACLACALLVPFGCNFLWNRHLKLVYSDANESKHAMNVSHYESVFKEKTPEDVKAITEKFISHCFDFKGNRIACNMLILNGAILLLLLLSVFKQRRRWLYWLKIFAACNGIFLVYTVGILAMYLFSMPTSEAMYLASFSRYSETGLIFVLGIFLIAVLIRSANTGSHVRNLVIYLLSALALLYPLTAPAALEKLYKTPPYEGTLVETMDETLKDVRLSGGNSYLIYYPINRYDAGFAHYLTQYKLQTKNIYIIDKTTPAAQLAEKLPNFTYLLVLEEDSEAESLLNGIKDSGDLRGGYKTSEILKALEAS